MAVKKFSLEAVIDLTDKMTAPVQNIERRMSRFSNTMQKNLGGVGRNIRALDAGINRAVVGLGVAAVAGTAAAFAIGKSFVEAGAEVEKYKTVLTTMLGSADLANQRFEEMSKFAASTPFELNEVVELGNQLQALGRYSQENMTTLGDLAAAAGKPIDQVAGAYAKLASGQKGMAVDMFRDLLITTDDWVKATGKGVSASGSLLATTEEMMAALPQILAKKGFAGMMDQLSKSYTGMSSNFADTVTRFRQNIGSMLLPAAKNLMGALTEKMMEFSDVTTEKGKRAVEAVSRVVDFLAEKISSIDIAAVADKVIGFFSGLGRVLGFIKQYLPIILALVVAIKLIVAVMTVWTVVLGILNVVSAPTLLLTIAIIAAVALLAAGVYMMVKHWQSVVNVLKIVGGLFVNIGQTMMKWLLMPINLVLDAVGALLGLLSKIPGMGDKLAPAMEAINGFQSGMNRTLTGEADAYDFKGTWGGSGYSNPDTRVSESRSSSTSTTRNVVDIQAPAGFGLQQRGSGTPPMPRLNYGGVQ